MKIGIYDPYLDDGGGGEKYMLKLAECLSREHDVTFFWNSKEDFDLAVSRFNIDTAKMKLGANIFSPKVSFFKKILETRKYDAIIILSDGSIPLSFSKKLFIHFQRPIDNLGKGFKNSIKFSRVNKIFCNSYFTKNYIDKQLGINSLVLYPPVELIPKKIKKENMILHVGRFRVIDRTAGVKDYKKQDVMIEAYRKMVDKGFSGWKFVLCANVKEEDEKAFEELRKKAGEAPVEFAVNKTNEELWDYYSRAKIYWHASGFGENLEDHPEAAEHFGISTVEAMGAGAVPIVINAGGQKEIVEDNINGFLWDNLVELEDRTKLLAREEKILESMSGAAMRRARDFAGERFCEEVIKLIGM